MRTHDLAAAVALAALSAVILSACLQAPASEENDTASPSTEQVSDPASEPAEHIGEAPEANVWVGAPYGPEDFPFKVEKKWDGKDRAGGRQRAFKLFVFVIRDVQTGQVRDSWPCPIDVSMPVQTRPVGYISPQRAAVVTADVANEVVPAVAHSRADWAGQSALFCNELKDQMNDVFRDEYEGYGARVIKWLR